MRRILFFLLLGMLAFVPVAAQANEGDSVREASEEGSLYVSLLTCSPGKEAYTLYGHTGIRVRNLRDDTMDVVFNYGMFDYSSDNFVYRFVKGETDYELGVEPMDYFVSRYIGRGFTVSEQELNLTDGEKSRLFELLRISYRPENRIYRYNCLYDNCTTRARDVIEKAVGEKIGSDRKGLSLTYRQLIHRFTHESPWTQLGIDMVFGAEADRRTTMYTQQFIPSVYMHDVDSMWIVDAAGVRRPFVRKTSVWNPVCEMEDVPSCPLTPRQAFWTLLVAAVVLSFIELRGRLRCLWLDVLLFSVQGVAGFLVAFLFFFSEHPTVDSNWLIAAFNPLVFVMIPNVVYLEKTKKPMLAWKGRDVLELANVAVLVFTLLLFCLPLQWINSALLPLVLTLFIRSCLRLYRAGRVSAR